MRSTKCLRFLLVACFAVVFCTASFGSISEDLNGDGVVDYLDLFQFLLYWQQDTGVPTATPTQTPTPTATPTPIITSISASEARDLLYTGADRLFLDVREINEYNAGHIPGATNMAYNSGYLAAHHAELPNRPIIVYCHSGGRSPRASRLLMANGHSDIYNMLGGFSAWQALPTFTPTPTPTPTSTPGGAIAESEPNNSYATAQSIGDLSPGDTIQVAGRVESGGMQGEQYIGDLDYYSFNLAETSNVSISISWSGTPDLDAALFVSEILLTSATGTEKPIQTNGPLSEGAFVILIASKNQAADYTITISATSFTPPYANDVSLLNGRYQADAVIPTFLHWYQFDGVGSYEYWNWIRASGNIVMHSGSYSIWYPYLILEYDTTMEALMMEYSEAPEGITLDYLWWGKC
jgi:rhodanese-related sulfurtransferase